MIMAECENSFILKNFEYLISHVGKGMLFATMSILLFDMKRKTELFVSLVLALVAIFNALLNLFTVDGDDKGIVKNVRDDEDNESLLSFYMKQNGDMGPQLMLDHDKEDSRLNHSSDAVNAKMQVENM